MKALFQELSRHRRDVVLLNAVMLAATLLFWVFLPDRWEKDQNYDYLTYYQPVAQRLLNGAGLREASGAPATHYPPGYSILLAGVFGAAKITGVSQVAALSCFILICSALSVMLVYAIALSVFGGRIALVSGLLWATYPFFLWLSKQPNSETPFLVFFLATIYSFVAFWPEHVRPEWPAVRTGILAGLTSLVRPASILLSFILAALLVYGRRDLRFSRRAIAALLLLAGNVAAVMPWEIWVWQQKGRWILLSQGSPVGLIEGMNFALGARGSGVPLRISPNIRELMTEASAHPERISTIGGVVRFLLEKARHDPATVLEFLLFKARRAWYGTQAQWLESWTAAIQALYLCIILAGAVIALRWRGPPFHYALLALLCTGYIWAMSLVVVPLLRYMIPAMSLLMVLAAVCINRLLEKAASPARRLP